MLKSTLEIRDVTNIMAIRTGRELMCFWGNSTLTLSNSGHALEEGFDLPNTYSSNYAESIFLIN